MNTKPQARSEIILIPIGKGTIRILIHPCPEFPQSQSCIYTRHLEHKEKHTNRQTNNINVQLLVLENLPSALRDQDPWILTLTIKTKKSSKPNPIGVHLPTISWRTKCSSGWYSKSPGFFMLNNPFKPIQTTKKQLYFVLQTRNKLPDYDGKPILMSL